MVGSIEAVHSVVSSGQGVAPDRILLMLHTVISLSHFSYILCQLMYHPQEHVAV